MSALGTIWPEIKKYLQQGLSIIPVRDKDEVSKSKTFVKKSPYSKWKIHQSQKMTEGDLYFQMDQNNTTWIAIVCGAISGNLEVIDVDNKNWAGIDALLFKNIQSLFPELFDKLRIHRSLTGGYHILYKIDGQCPPGNKKLAWKEGQKEAALETRGEGGFVVSPPSVGYSVFKDNPIPTITWEERCSLIAICEGYNEKVKTKEVKSTIRTASDYYDENPFDHYNKSPEAEKILINNGWKPAGESNTFIWFTRPGKDSGISASFNKEKRCYYVFTSSTILEVETGYNPATVLSILQHNGDKKATFSYLVNNGYGKVKSSVELKKAEKLARAGAEPPANFSEEAKKHFQEVTKKLNEAHPFGTFWEYDDEYKIVISREAITKVASELGFRLYKGELIRVNGQIIFDSTEREFQDVVKAYIKEEDADEYETICNSYESFMQKNGKYTISRLPLMTDIDVIRDTTTSCFKFFKNGYLEIKAEAITAHDYADLDKYIFNKKILPRDYNLYEGGKYVEYLQLATDWENQSDHIKKCIGYLAHEYKDETTGYIIVLTEQCPDPQDGGGSGKNVFCNLLSNTTTYHSKNGSQVKFDEKFFQSWSGQRIMAISDVPKNFNFAFLKEPSTGTFILKKLFKDEVEIPVEDGPKFIVQTNYSYEITDGGLRRRIIHIEFTDFFTKSGGIDVHFGCHFPKGWTDNDWHGFDTLIIQSVQLYLAANRKLTNSALTQTGWEKQFEFTYGQHCAGIIKEYIDKWIEAGEVTTEQISADIAAYYSQNEVPVNFRPSKQRLNSAISAYCKHNKILFSNDNVRKDMNISIRYYAFSK